MKAAGLRPAAAPVSTADASSRQTHAFHFPPFFPSFSSAPRMPDRTPRLPSARRPPAERAQRGSSETPEKGRGIPSRGRELGGPSPPAARGTPRGSGGPTVAVEPQSTAIFFFFASLPGREGGDFKFTSGRAPWGSGSNLSTGCLSSAAEKSIAQGPGLSRRWIKLQTPTPLLLHSGQSEPILQRGL